MSRQTALLWGGVALALVALSPLAPYIVDGLWTCPFKSVTGVPCPTCGTARAALALSRGEVWHALTQYPLPSLAWILFVAGGFYSLWLGLTKRLPISLPKRLPVWARISIVVAVAANWIYSIVSQ